MTHSIESEGDKFQEYAGPEVLVSSDWVAAHLDDPKVHLIEAGKDINYDGSWSKWGNLVGARIEK